MSRSSISSAIQVKGFTSFLVFLSLFTRRLWVVCSFSSTVFSLHLLDILVMDYQRNLILVFSFGLWLLGVCPCLAMCLL